MTRLACIQVYFICISIVIGQELPSAQEVLDEIRLNYYAVEDYEVDIQVSMSMPGLRIPGKKVHYYYKYPDKSHMEAEGFAVLPKGNILPLDQVLLEDSLDVEVVDQITLGDRLTWEMIISDSLIGRDIKMHIWVDQRTGVVLQSIAKWDTTSVMSAYFHYKRIDDIAYLPVKTDIELRMPPQFRDLQILGHNPLDARNLSQELKDNKDWVDGSISLEFSNYRVNRGLPDDLFPKEEEKEKVE